MPQAIVLVSLACLWGLSEAAKRDQGLPVVRDRSTFPPHWKVMPALTLPPTRTAGASLGREQEASGLGGPVKPGPGRATPEQQGTRLPRGLMRHMPPPCILFKLAEKMGGGREEKPHYLLPLLTTSARGKEPDAFPYHGIPRPSQLTHT